jgi:glycosyltransferase involved in cell wall biosynthesis
MPKVSIIIATHSRPKLLPRAVKSAQAAGTDVEVVVVDDASTDETAEVCQKLEDIKYVRVERNQHTAGARNIGLMVATAPYVGFLDDDDWRLPDSLDKQVELLEQNPGAGLVYGQFLSADQGGNIIAEEQPIPLACPQGDVFWRILEGPIFGCLTAVFRRECIQKVGLLDPTYSGADDWDLWVRILEIYEAVAVHEPVAVWRKPAPGSNQGSENMSRLYALAAKAYKEKWLGLPRVVNEATEDATLLRRRLLRQLSERIVYDMVYDTSSRSEALLKLVEVIRCYPRRALEISFYSMLVRNIFHVGGEVK